MRKLLLAFILVSVCWQSDLISQTVIIGGTVRDIKSLAVVDSARVDIVNTANPAEKYTVFANSLGQWQYIFQPSGIPADPSLPAGFMVDQNFPNPFNPSTQIRVTALHSGTLRVTVFNSVGQQLDFREYQVTPGQYAVPWSAKGAAGVLIYAVDFGGRRITKKMMQLDGGGNGGLGELLGYGGVSAKPALPGIQASYYVIASKLIYWPDTVIISMENNSTVNFSLSTVHDKAFLIDLHNDVLEKVITGYQLGGRQPINHSDLVRFREGGVDAQMFAVWVSPSDTIAHPAYTYSIAMMDSFQKQISYNVTELAQARSYSEIISIAASGKLAGILAVEGGHAIQNDLEKLREFYRRGMRYLTITWNNSTYWAVSAADSRSQTVGLNDFGRGVIRLLDSMGVLIDVAHTGIKTINDILAVTVNPIVDTHCGARALNNHTRNLYDYQIDSIARGGGVMGVVFYPPFLSRSNSATIDSVVKHIDYIKRRVGVDYVAIGSDFDGIESVPLGLEDVSRFPRLTEALLRKGYTIPEVCKILGGNYLRVFRQVCK